MCTSTTEISAYLPEVSEANYSETKGYLERLVADQKQSATIKIGKIKLFDRLHV